MGKSGVYCIHNRNFLIFYHIRIVSHSIGNYVLSLKKVYIMVIYSYIENVIGNLHGLILLLLLKTCLSQPFYLYVSHKTAVLIIIYFRLFVQMFITIIALNQLNIYKFQQIIFYQAKGFSVGYLTPAG